MKILRGVFRFILGPYLTIIFAGISGVLHSLYRPMDLEVPSLLVGILLLVWLTVLQRKKLEKFEKFIERWEAILEKYTQTHH